MATSTTPVVPPIGLASRGTRRRRGRPWSWQVRVMDALGRPTSRRPALVSCRRGSVLLCRSTRARQARRVAGPSAAPTRAPQARYGPRRPANSGEAVPKRAARYRARLGSRSIQCVARFVDRGDGLPSGIEILPVSADVTSRVPGATPGGKAPARSGSGVRWSGERARCSPDRAPSGVRSRRS
jgi:hypothetical protein